MMDDVRWQAVLERDARADGRFFYGVRSTGIFCRPSCPSRRPRREHVRFFDTAAAAESAGFRPCQRCRPEGASNEERVVAAVKQAIDEALEPLSLAALGELAGMSPFHLQRLFKRATGLSPAAYGRMVRAERLKDGLRQGATVVDATYGAGYGSSRAVYEGATAALGMSPGAYRRGGAGVRIRYACTPVRLGQMLLAATDRGLCALWFGDDAAELVAQLAAEFPRAERVEDATALGSYVAAVEAYLAGEPGLTELPLDLRATPFQERVWTALRAIPYGEVRSYQEVAAQIGSPSAVRAVARACASNRVALAIPCHRVVRSTGELSGYRWGVERKRALLEGEAGGAALDQPFR